MVFNCLLWGGTPFIIFPSKITSPESGSWKPAIILSVVVLPQPEGPKKVINSLSRIYKFIFSIICWPSNATEMFFNSIILLDNYAAPLRKLRIFEKISLFKRKNHLPKEHRMLFFKLVNFICPWHQLSVNPWLLTRYF